MLTPAGFVWVPIAQVRLSHGSRSLDVEMTVDSGSDLVMFPYQVGVLLGMERGTGPVKQLSGIAGAVPYVMKRVGIRIGPFSFRAKAAWAQDDEVPLLLGRADVFKRFVVSFDERRRTGTIRA